jgi:hypothetical protein
MIFIVSSLIGLGFVLFGIFKKGLAVHAEETTATPTPAVPPVASTPSAVTKPAPVASAPVSTTPPPITPTIPTTSKATPSSNNSSMFIIVGVVIFIIGAAFFLINSQMNKSKTVKSTTSTTTEESQEVKNNTKEEAMPSKSGSAINAPTSKAVIPSTTAGTKSPADAIGAAKDVIANMGNKYPQVVIDNFTSSCKKSAGEKGAPICDCAIAEIQKKYTLTDFMNLENDYVKTQKIPDALTEIVQKCALDSMK